MCPTCILIQGNGVVLNVVFSFADAVTKLGGAQHKVL